MQKKLPHSESDQDFNLLFKRVGRLDVSGKTVLVPSLDPYFSHLFAASFRAFDIQSVVMPTFTGLERARRHTSGKECFPCQVTLGDLLNHLQTERDRLGSQFSPDKYIYFLPTSAGPCRFGMYNKIQRIALDSYPEFRNVGISCLSADDAYKATGLVPERFARTYLKLTFMAQIIGDIMNRMTWRVRPYETQPGQVDWIMDAAKKTMIGLFEDHGSQLNFKPMYDLLAVTAQTLSACMNSAHQRRPQIAIVGEIYLRSHTQANHDIARQIEQYGGEVVVSSITEWTQYVTFRLARIYRSRIKSLLKSGSINTVFPVIGTWLQQELQSVYISHKQDKTYKHVLKYLDIQPDMDIREINREIDNGNHYSFILGSETPVTIGAALNYARNGINGVVNIYPFGCMPGNASSVILKPMLRKMNMPFIEISCDGTYQPIRETALRTFMYQAGATSQFR